MLQATQSKVSGTQWVTSTDLTNAHEETVVIETYDGLHYPELWSWYSRDTGIE